MLIKPQCCVLFIFTFIYLLICLSSLAEAKIRIRADHKAVLLEWSVPTTTTSGSKLPSEQIAGYHIYRSTTRGKDYLRINKELITETSYIDRDLIHYTTYYYVLTVVDQSGDSSSYSREVEITLTLPCPSGFAATAGKETVILKWNKYKDAEVRGYYIYRGEQPGGPYTRISLQPDIITEYRDQNLIPGKNYYYVITGVDLDGKESEYSPEIAVTPMMITPDELAQLEDIKGLEARIEGNKIIITWQTSGVKNVAGYNLYRRTTDLESKGFTTSTSTAYTRLNRNSLLTSSPVVDDQISPGYMYYYTIAAVNIAGHEAQFPRELKVAYNHLFITSISEDTENRPQKASDTIIITLTGSPGVQAGFEINKVYGMIGMKETEPKGTYYGQYQVKPGDNLAKASVRAYLFDSNGHSVSMECSTKITIDTLPPSPVSELHARVDEVSQVILTWRPYDGQEPIDHLRLYRSQFISTPTPTPTPTLTPTSISASDVVTNPGQGQYLQESSNYLLINNSIPSGLSMYIDNSVQGDQAYSYTLVTVDLAGNESVSTCSSKVTIPPDTLAPRIFSVQEISPTGIKTTGDIIEVVILGEPKAQASFSIADTICQIARETTSPGKYKGQYTVKEGDSLNEKPIRAILRDGSGNQSLLETTHTITINPNTINSNPDGIAPIISQVMVKSCQEPLVSGDHLLVEVIGTPGCNGYLDLGGYRNQDGSIELNWEGFLSAGFDKLDGFNLYVSDYKYISDYKSPFLLSLGIQSYRLENYHGEYTTVTARNSKQGERIILTPRFDIPLKEIEPGVYEGNYPVFFGDYLTRGKVAAKLKDQAGLASDYQASSTPITIDTSVQIIVKPEKKSLPADGISETRVLVTALDMRDGPVVDHKIRLELFTTSEYTGIIGVGRFDQQDFGELSGYFSGETDPWGTAEAVYTSGKSAKTVIIRATDEITDNRGLAYITSWIEGSINIELLPQNKSKSRYKSGDFFMTLTSDHEWLTADGVSQTRIRAMITDDLNKPVSGHKLVFAITEGGGHINSVQNITDQNGQAIALYTAGTKIGTVEIKAIDISANISGQIPLILKSDAPTIITINSDHVSLPANGASTSPILIEVADLNRNPNRGVLVEVKIIKGSGTISQNNLITDFFGQATTLFTAGYDPGTTTIAARITSKIPSQEEMDLMLNWKKPF